AQVGGGVAGAGLDEDAVGGDAEREQGVAHQDGFVGGAVDGAAGDDGAGGDAAGEVARGLDAAGGGDRVEVAGAPTEARGEAGDDQAVDLAAGARGRGGPERAAAEELDAAQEGAVGDAGGGEHHVALREILEAVDAVVVLHAHLLGAPALVVVAVAEDALHVAAHAAERGRGEHALGGAADAEEDVDAGVGLARGDGGGDVAVGDEADARAGLAHLPDQRL